MRQVKKVLSFHFEEGRSGRFIARHCAMARRSVAQTLTRFAASGLSWPQARDPDDEALEAALYPPKQDVSGSDVDWAQVEKDLAGRGMTLFVLWEEWRDTNPDAMSYPTWCRRFREARSRQDVTMRQNRSPGERLFVDYAGMTVPLLTADGKTHATQVFVAAMGVSGRLYIEATLTQKVEDWCASHVRCFEDMGSVPHVVVCDDVPGNIIDEQDARHTTEGFEGFYMALQEAAHPGVVEQAQMGLAGVGQGHEKPHQLVLGAADPDTPEVGPVDLGLFAGKKAHPHRRLGPLDGPQAEIPQTVTEVVGPAAIAPCGDLPVKRAGRQIGGLLEPLLDVGNKGVDELRTVPGLLPGAPQGPRHRAVMNAAVPRNGAHRPPLGP